MTIVQDAFNAGIDAVIADPTINRAAFVDAMQTVITSGLSNAEGNAFVDAVAAEYNRLGVINNPTYNNLRNEINNEGADTSKAMFLALGSTIGALPEFEPVALAGTLVELRDARDNADAAIDRLDDLIAAEPPGTIGRFVKGILRNGKTLLRQEKQAIRDQIQNLTGDPDS